MSHKYALVIAVENYYDKRITQVKYAKNDALAIVGALTKHGYSEPILLGEYEATKTTIETQIMYMSKMAVKGDQLVIFYAGHGYADGNKNYITCYDTNKDYIPLTSVSLQYVMDELNKSDCKQKVIFLDSCHSGILADSSSRSIYSKMSSEQIKEFLKDSKYCIAFASCESEGESYSSDTLQHGIWTHHLTLALLGQAKEALADKRLITAISLQNYLKSAVPKSVRTMLTGTKIQTPCAYGNITGDFVVADVWPILEEIKTKSRPTIEYLKDSLFSRVETGLVKSLSGFIKGKHNEPKWTSHATKQFVADVSRDDLKNIGDQLYKKIKDKLRYKSKDIVRKDYAGNTSLILPDFDLEITISQNDENPKEYVLETIAHNFRNPAIVRDVGFNEVFANVFDTIEITFAGKLDIEKLVYDIEDLEEDDIVVEYFGHQECKIELEGVEGIIEVFPDRIKLSYCNCKKPIDIIKDFLTARKELVNTKINTMFLK